MQWLRVLLGPPLDSFAADTIAETFAGSGDNRGNRMMVFRCIPLIFSTVRSALAISCWALALEMNSRSASILSLRCSAAWDVTSGESRLVGAERGLPTAEASRCLLAGFIENYPTI